ncbi:MAG: hypothetical protein ACFCVD_01480 [Nodosilinea sp.]
MFSSADSKLAIPLESVLQPLEIQFSVAPVAPIEAAAHAKLLALAAS